MTPDAAELVRRMVAAYGREDRHRRVALSPRRDVIFAFFGVSYAASLSRGKIMPEDRLVDALFEDARVRRLIVAEPYRSVAAYARDVVKRQNGTSFPATPDRSLYAPGRLRRTTPVDPSREIARYEAGLRRLAERRGLERPAIISADPLLAGYGRFDWAGRVTYYGWDDWAASRPHERLWPAYEEAFARMQAEGRTVVAVSQGILDRVATTGPAAVIPNGIEPSEWVKPPPPPDW